MKRATGVAAVLAVALVAAVPLAQGSKQAEPGVSSDTIKIGGTFPVSGAASSYAAIGNGMDAYFAWVNGRGGVFGRKIDFVIKDDGYSPPQTVLQTRALVERERVFAIVGSVGTANNVAIRPYLNQRKVPHLLISSGAATWGTDWGRFKYSIGWQPDYQSEGAIYARWLLKNKPKAKIAVLYQNDGYGLDYVKGLERALGAKRSMIVAKEGYEVTEPDVRAQVSKLKSAGADTLMLFSTPRFTTQGFQASSQLGWKPLTFVNSVSATDTIMGAASAAAGAAQVEGAISINNLKDPSNPKWANDSGMKLYRTILKKFGPRNANANDLLYLYGMAKAQTFVQMLRGLGKDPTRQKMVDSLSKLNIKDSYFLLPGVTIQTTAKDHFLLEQAKLFRYQGGTFRDFGPLIDARP